MKITVDEALGKDYSVVLLECWNKRSIRDYYVDPPEGYKEFKEKRKKTKKIIFQLFWKPI